MAYPPTPRVNSLVTNARKALGIRERITIGGNYKCRNCCNEGASACPSGGKPDSQFVILGESPGEVELRQGRPFAGQTGDFLQAEINEIAPAFNIEAECFLINAINCDVNHTFWTNSQKRKFIPATDCFGRVLTEIFSEKRKLILAFGNINLWTYTRDTTLEITAERGKWKSFRFSGSQQCIPVLHTIHPTHAKIMKNMPAGSDEHREYINFCGDIKSAIEFYRGKIPNPIFGLKDHGIRM